MKDFEAARVISRVNDVLLEMGDIVQKNQKNDLQDLTDIGRCLVGAIGYLSAALSLLNGE